MKKIAFLYPGQGSQKVGMGKNFSKLYPPARNIFEEAHQILGFDVEKICTEGPEKELTRTYNLQPALLTINWILTRFIKEKGVLPSAVAGHSLGEYSALLAAEVIDFPEGLKIVKERARLMEKAGKENKGSMAAVIGMSAEDVLKVCNQTKDVYVVNFNCPGQVVISGRRDEVTKTGEKLKKIGARGIIPLPVSGAFHSPLMKEASKEFSSFLENFEFKDPICPVVSNSTGNYATTGRQVKENLKLQMDHPVLWEKSMRLLLTYGFNVFLEVGPGKVLQGLMKRINKRVTLTGIESVDSINQVKTLLSS